MSVLGGAQSLDLDQPAAHSEDDVRTYLRLRLGARHLDPSAEAIDRLGDLAGGSFLWASTVMNGALRGDFDLADPDALPRDLMEAYWRMFRQRFPDLESYRVEPRSLFEVLCVQREIIPLPVLEQVLEWEPYRRRDTVAAAGSLLMHSDGGLRPMHASLLEWMMQEESAGVYWVDVRAGHRRLADAGLRARRLGARPESYVFRHAIAHAAAAGKFAEAAGLLRHPEYLETRLELESADSDLRRAARFAHREDIVELGRCWPAGLDEDPIVGSVIEFARVGWNEFALGERYPHRNHYHEGYGLLTSVTYTVSELAEHDRRWIRLIPIILNYERGREFPGVMQGIISRNAPVMMVDSGRMDSEGPIWNLSYAVSLIVTRWSRDDDPQLAEWTSHFRPDR